MSSYMTQTSLSRGASTLSSERFGSLRVSEPWGLMRIEGLKVHKSGGLWFVLQEHGMWEAGWDPLNCTCVGLSWILYSLLRRWNLLKGWGGISVAQTSRDRGGIKARRTEREEGCREMASGSFSIAQDRLDILPPPDRTGVKTLSLQVVPPLSILEETPQNRRLGSVCSWDR